MQDYKRVVEKRFIDFKTLLGAVSQQNLGGRFRPRGVKHRQMCVDIQGISPQNYIH